MTRRILILVSSYVFDAFVLALSARISSSVSVGDKFWFMLIAFVFVEIIIFSFFTLITAISVVLRGLQYFSPPAIGVINNLVEFLSIIATVGIFSKFPNGFCVESSAIIIVSFLIYFAHRCAIVISPKDI